VAAVAVLAVVAALLVGVSAAHAQAPPARTLAFDQPVSLD
jgi:hypothetical protein